MAARATAVFHGNCQAVALGRVLAATPSFAERYEHVELPEAHRVGPGELGWVREAVAAAGLVVTQEVRDGYHGMPVGTRELLALAAPACRVVRVPALYCDATLPLQVYVRDATGLPVDAPLTTYHDLRAVHAARTGLGARDAARLRPAPEGLRAVAERALATLRWIERGADVQVVDAFAAPDRLGAAFHTINHPGDATMQLLRDGVLAELGLPPAPPWSGPPVLGKLRAPLEAPVVEALGLPDAPSATWRVGEAEHGLEEVLAAQVAGFAARPGLAAAAAAEHAERLAELQLALPPRRVRGLRARLRRP